jgi:hypothetical protein
MYLPALHCYRAMALQRLDRQVEAEKLLRTCVAEWEAGLAQRDYGYFAATPFFHSFLAPPSRVRKVHYSWLLGLAHLALVDVDTARGYFRAVVSEDAGHLQATLELEELGR